MKISIIGTGRLGGLNAYTIASRQLADEIVLVDQAAVLAEGQAMDLEHAMAHRSAAAVKAGAPEDIDASDVVIITAGKPRQPGQTRLDLARENAAIVAGIADGIRRHAPRCIVITVTNPMDAMNWLVWKRTGFPRSRVIGEGGQLDSARLKTILGKKLGAAANRVEAFVLGEHGESQVPVLSRVKVEGRGKRFPESDFYGVRAALAQAAMQVIEKKKGTEYAPAACTGDMVEAIVRDTKALIPCSAVLDGEYGLRGVSTGVPCVLGRKGIEKIEEWELSAQEVALFDAGAETTRRTCAELETGW